jgi:cytochrome c-type biogenesis protein
MAPILLALLAGVLTIAAPCTLPVLPVLLGASIGQTSRLRPALIALGFIVSFAAATLVFSAVTQLAGLDQNTLRGIAIVLLLAFGLFMLWPRPFEWLTTQLAGLINRGNGNAAPRYAGNAGGFVLGTTLGLVWTPCAGPVLGSILTLIATTPDHTWAGGLLSAYAVGAAIPMLAIAYGGQAVTTRVRSFARIAPRLQQGFGVVVIIFALAMYAQYDVLLTTWLAGFYPNGQLGL